MKREELLSLIEDLRKGDSAFILFGNHLTGPGREQVASILEANPDEYILPEYSDKFDCITSAAETFHKQNGLYPESDAEVPPSFAQ